MSLGLGNRFGRMGNVLGRAGTSAGPANNPISAVAATFTSINNVRNPLGLGAVAGTPGTLADLWTWDISDTSKGISVVHNGYVTLGGQRCQSITISGTATAGAVQRVQAITDTFVEKPSIQRAKSIWLAVSASSGTFGIKTIENTSTSAGVYINTPENTSRTLTGTLTKFGPTTYTTDVGTGKVDSGFQVTYTIGVAFSVTLIIGIACSKRGTTTDDAILPLLDFTSAFATRPIPESYFAAHIDTPQLGGNPYPYVNGPQTFFGWSSSANSETRWNDTINPSNGVYVWTTVDAWVAGEVAAARSPGMTLLRGDTKPSWVTGSASNPNDASWRAFATAFINRYYKTIRNWITLNEVDGGVFWTGTQADVVAKQQFVYQTVMALDTKANVFYPTVTGSSNGMLYLDALIGLGINQYTTVFGFHNYNQSAHYLPELDAANAAQHNFVLSINGISKPMLDTESGQGLNSNLATSDLRADFCIKKLLLGWVGGANQQDWFAVDDPNDGTLWDSGGAGYTDTATARKIGRLWTNGATLSNVSVTGTIATLSYTRTGGYTAFVVWDLAGVGANYTVPSGVVQYRDRKGNRYLVNTGDLVPVTSSPLLFESSNTLGTIGSGWILSPVQSGKSVWDTARDGSLPFVAPAYNAVAIANGTQFVTTYVEDHFNNTTAGAIALPSWTPDTIGSVAWSVNTASGNNQSVQVSPGKLTANSSVGTSYVNKVALPSANYQVAVSVKDTLATFSGTGPLLGYSDTVLTSGYRAFFDAPNKTMSLSVGNASVLYTASILPWTTGTEHTLTLARYVMTDRTRTKLQDSLSGQTSVLDIFTSQQTAIGYPGESTRQTGNVTAVKVQSVQPQNRGGTEWTPDAVRTWFNGPNAIRVGTATLSMYVRKDGSVVVGKLDGGVITETVLDSALEVDDHNDGTLVVDPVSGRLFACWSKHSTETTGMRYKVSTNAAPDISAFGALVQVPNITNRATAYAKGFVLSDGYLRVYFRSNAANPRPQTVMKALMSDVIAGTPTWALGDILQVSAQRAYVKCAQNGTGRVDFVVTDGHPGEVASTSIYHCYMLPNTGTGIDEYFMSDGTQITGSKPYNIKTQLTKILDGATVGSCWFSDIQIGADGFPRVIAQVYPSSTGVDTTFFNDIQYWHCRWTGSAWTNFKAFQGQYSIYYTQAHYSGCAVFDGNDLTKMYVSLIDTASGVYQLSQWSVNEAAQTVSKTRDISTDTTAHQFRPVSPLNHGTDCAVTWIEGGYVAFTNYQTTLRYST